MNLSFTALVTIGLGLSAIAAMGKSPDTAVSASVARSDARETGDRFRLRSMDNLSCDVVRGTAASDGVYTLRASPECDGLLPGLSRVRFWQERDGGVIVFGGNLADDLISFAVADGVAYESFRPASALISLTAYD